MYIHTFHNEILKATDFIFENRTCEFSPQKSLLYNTIFTLRSCVLFTQTLSFYIIIRRARILIEFTIDLGQEMKVLDLQSDHKRAME